MTKANKKPKVHSFANRLSWWMVFTLLFSMGFVSYSIYKLGAVIVEEELVSHSITLRDLEVEKIRRTLSDFYVGVSNHVPEIEEHLDRPDRLFKLMERVINENKSVRSCGMCFKADYYPQKGRSFCPYAMRTDEGQVKSFNLSAEQYDYLEMEWFTEALKSDTGYWSKPFLDGYEADVPLISYLIPIRDRQGQTVAVLGADLSLEGLNRRVEEVSTKVLLNLFVDDNEEDDEDDDERDKQDKKHSRSRDAYSFIITEDGTYLAHPKKERIYHHNYFEDVKSSPDTMATFIGKKMVNGQKGNTYEDLDETIYLDDSDHSYYVFYAPIKHTDWSLAVVQPSLKIKAISIAIGVLFLLLIVFGLFVLNLVSRIVIKRSVKPLKLLAFSAEEVAKGNFNTPLPKIRHKDEIWLLRNSFETMQHSLATYIRELTDTTTAKVSIERDLQIAHTIQMALLPKTFPPFPERSDIDVYGLVQPAKEVGGDLFDFFIRDEKLFFCIGDVSGKGIPASLFMAITRTLFRNVASHETEPNKIVAAINRSVSDGNGENMFVTLFVGVLNLTDGHLLYCNAGHDAPMLIDKDDITFLQCDANLPVGVFDSSAYSLQETVLKADSTIFLYTDGLNEAENSAHMQFGQQRMVTLVETLQSEGAVRPEKLVERMRKAVKSFVENAEQSDDLTMLAIQRKK